MSYDPNVGEFFDNLGKRFDDNLQAADKAFNALLAFINLGKVPDGMRRIRLKYDYDYFKPEARKIFFQLYSQLTAHGVAANLPRVVTGGSRAPRPTQSVASVQGVEGEEESLQPEARVNEGRFGGIGRRISGGLGSLSGFIAPVLKEQATIQEKLQEPFDQVLELYYEGVIYVDRYGSEMAEEFCMTLRMEIAKRLTALIRNIRTYTHENEMAIGANVTHIAGG